MIPAMGCDCKACGGMNTVVTPSRAWWVVVVAVWTLLLGFGACFAILLPLNLVLVPCWLACATSVGPMARKLAETRCKACGVQPGTREALQSAARRTASEVAGRLAGPAHEGAMEGALVREPHEQRDFADGARAVA